MKTCMLRFLPPTYAEIGDAWDASVTLPNFGALQVNVRSTYVDMVPCDDDNGDDTTPAAKCAEIHGSGAILMNMTDIVPVQYRVDLGMVWMRWTISRMDPLPTPPWTLCCAGRMTRIYSQMALSFTIHVTLTEDDVFHRFCGNTGA